jgi:hypothetical protein
MSLFRLTIAEDEVDKRTEGYRNLMSMLYGFTIAISITLVSGFWYYFVPRDINWNASQTILVLHLAGGVISLLLIVAYFFLHQKDKDQKWWWIFTPWKLRKEEGEELQHFNQRRLGHLLTWCFLAIYGTGIVIALPGLLFLFKLVWMQGYYTSQILNFGHFWLSVGLLPFLLVHMLWIARKGA